ncbi:MAG: phage holin family protein [candidate division Zixibacteria bacterium]|jgi:putative membrane protein|nr:phage holin family protein [candidate division Zixibacteria bacterium]NIR63728.1 phage holin family protein [candidate division Zixibacteria bacterium]NIS14685.1 phage holin family protein [candidate division Zixibacteria bacterium]NIS45684.1 phage holin family protein [candidate division Zixibacteria bacterium]NIT51213.1 phage holin family protein [candidate division Zixibacteria bacterium]
MVKFLTSVIIYAIAIFMVSWLFDLIAIESPGAWIVASLVLGVLNALVRPLLVLITLPLTILTLGLFTLIINGALLYLMAAIVSGVEIESFWRAVLAALLITIISAVMNALISDRYKIKFHIHRRD